MTAENKIIPNTIQSLDKNEPIEKYVINTPVTKARLFIPKAKPGYPGNKFATAVSIIGIVRLNRNIHNIPAKG